MRLTEFEQLVEDEFGPAKARWVTESQVLPKYNATAAEIIERGIDPREAWIELCEAFDVPAERRLGVDRPGW
ncbi:DUF3046 domain-containing protein [Corynebacterium timonense]|uniref:DUF3046 domain-containing protein n=1 Tax=Corynebacterium timonense TaxID=441500 RepID=A0A1H1N845_9CORY|nr:DUF3046 domain-containing protein [Corynebacterium timonense]SDR95050.1 Protein of unknown function [Corynebacterium timonense]